MQDDYKLWKAWWYAVLYNAGPQKRMEIIDERRKEVCTKSMDGDDSWLYVSEGPIDELRVCLMTLEEAQEAAEAWRIEGHEEAIEIVEYQECIS